MIVKQKDMETLKTLWRGLSGLGTFAALILTAIGGFGFLIYEKHYLFAVALIVVLAFALKPMKKFIETRLL